MSWSAVAAGGASALDFISQERTNAQNRQEASKLRSWQEYMSNTAYRRSVADMRAAGINPIAVYSKGGVGASTPPGAKAQIENPTRNLSSHVASAVQAVRVDKENEVRDAQISDLKASANLKNEQAKVAGQNFWLSEAQQENQQSQSVVNSKRRWVEVKRAQLLDEQIKLAKTQVHSAQAEADKRKRQAEIDLKLINLDNTLKRLGGVGRVVPRKFNFNRFNRSKGFDRYNKYLDQRGK